MSLRSETEVLAKLMQAQQDTQNTGWTVRLESERVPAATGHYALYDGLEVRSCGVTRNMRQSIEACAWFGNLKRPIFMFLFDLDGSAEDWLEQLESRRPDDARIYYTDQL